MMSGPDRHLIVDGYNMIHGIGALRSILEESQEAACESLIGMSRTIHDEEGMRVTVVFDGREKQTQIQHPCGRTSFSVVYAPRDLTADGVIERMLARMKKPELATVASRDNMIREAAAARGAFFVDGDSFEDWVRRCERQTRSRLGSQAERPWKQSLSEVWRSSDADRREGA